MNELRWILIGFGFIVVAGIYLWGRRGGAEPAEASASRMRPEPRVTPFDESDPAVPEPSSAASRMAPPVSHMQGDLPPVLDDDSEGASALHEPLEPVRPRLEPTFAARPPEVTAEIPVNAAEAPTLSLSDSPTPRRIERRKILALRLAAGSSKLEGTRLLEALKAESLEHGKYEVFHRLHSDGAIVFSVASMIEPGTFDVAKMPQAHYPGITLFAQLPGPVAGMYALNELVACAKRLQSLAGTLQDDRGIPLTVHRIERMRQEVREFERPPAAPAGRSYSQSASP
jgi:cell division protein ZipA